MKEKSKFPEWLIVVLLIILGFFSLLYIYQSVITIIAIYFSEAGSSTERLGYLIGIVLVGVALYFGFKKLITMWKKK